MCCFAFMLLFNPWARAARRARSSSRRQSFSLHFTTMPKRMTASDASDAWTDTHYEQWERQRGFPKARTQAETSSHSTRSTWTNLAARAKELAKARLEAQQPSGAGSSAGADRPAFASDVLTLDEAKAYWRELTNMAFSVPGNFEPQQYVSFVAGRPVVVIRVKMLRTSHSADKFSWVPSASQSIAFHKTMKMIN